MIGARRTLPSAATLASAGALALGLAGCGGHRATRSAVIARGNAICATATRALQDLPPAAGATSVDFRRAAPIVTREADALMRLPRPAAERATLERFLAAESALAAGYRRLARIPAGDTAAITRALGPLESDDAGRLARAYGLDQCTGTTATVR